MAWIKSSEEYRGRDEEARTRAAYTWEKATTDLTYMTRLTLMESGRVIEEFRRSNVHPYDALPWIVKIYSDKSGYHDPAVVPVDIAREIVELIRLERTLDEGNSD
jgi:hypothetical protein